MASPSLTMSSSPPPSYKSSKEAFVTGMTGSSILHVNLASSVALASIFLYYALQSRRVISSQSLVSASVVLGLPLLLCMTLFADRPVTLFLLCAVPGAAVCIGIERKDRLGKGEMLPSSASAAGAMQSQSSNASLTQLPSLTTYRSHMLLMTMLAILAVDFPVFPRNMVKCETFGVSLMDIGVGSFVFASGTVSAIPLIKNPSHLTAPMIPKIVTIVKKCLPIILLGVVRVLLVKGTEYPEHETEYGTHWNFFITLALLPIMQVFLHPLMARLSLTGMGVAVAFVQQFFLLSPRGLNLQHYVLHVERERANFFSANKEGFVSLMGYFAIHLLGLATGTLILPPSPSYFRRAQRELGTRLARKGTSAGAVKKKVVRRDNSDSESDEEVDPKTGHDAELDPFDNHDTIQMRLAAPRQNDKTATELCAYAVAWWSLMALVGYMNSSRSTDEVERAGWGVSRRLVNLPYIFWICAYNVSFLLGYLLLDMLFYPSSSSGRNRKARRSPPTSPAGSTNYSRSPISPSPSVNTANLRPSSPLFSPRSPSPSINTANLRPSSPLHSPRSPSPSANTANLRPGSPLFSPRSPSPSFPPAFSPSTSFDQALPSPGPGWQSQEVVSRAQREVEDIPPPLLDAVNKNGLVLFLVANVLTGLINLTIPTMYTSSSIAMLVLCGYTWVVCMLAWWGRGRRIVKL